MVPGNLLRLIVEEHEEDGAGKESLLSSRYRAVRLVVLVLVVGAVVLAAGCLYLLLRQPDPIEL